MVDGVEVEQALRHQGELRCDYTPWQWMKLSSRLVLTRAACDVHKPQNGLLLSQDIFLYPTKTLTLSARYAWFSTGGYDARIYASEGWLQYDLTTPALQGRGHRAYLLVRWNIKEKLTLAARYGITIYTDRESVGSGYDVTQGPVRQDVRLQLRLKL